MRVPALLLFVIFLAPVAASAQKGGGKPAKEQYVKKEVKVAEPKKHKNTDTVGVVNGTLVTLYDYRGVLSEIIRRAARDSVVSEEDLTTYVNAAWDRVVENIIVESAIHAKNIAVTDDEALVAVATNPPDFLAEQFTDSAGKIRTDYIMMALRDPQNDSLVQIMIGAERIRLEQEALITSIAPKAVTPAERKKAFAAWLAEQTRKATIVDRRTAFGYY